MNQRAAVRGRPSGTDGSDFSYRMVVDSRYTKVAKAKSRLAKLIFAQVVTQLMIAASVFVSLSKNESPDRVFVSFLVIGFVSIVAGELGRRKSCSSFLKFYIFGSSMAILLSVAYLATSNLQLEAFQNLTSLETLKTAAVLLGFVVQLSVIGTTVSLIKNVTSEEGFLIITVTLVQLQMSFDRLKEVLIYFGFNRDAAVSCFCRCNFWKHF